ncbi:MAG: hypothetical protein KGY74_10900 [Candidatus Cloacimonetes bacterium]|nr:hypothetical protein [Candidatus Cloacimonadota bacterium]
MLKKITLIVLILIPFSLLWGNFEVDIESGAIFTGYNDVRIPGDEGTLFSLKEDLTTDVEPYFRSRLHYHFNPKHHLILLYAPLEVTATGKVDKDIDFQGEVFPANTDLKSIYKFNSYRITYRYDFVRKTNLTFGLGFTAKIRDAIISLENDTIKAEKENVGFVPIINFKSNWKMKEKLWLILEGDALAAPQGRAEDVALKLNYQLNKKLGLNIGYRLLEGGADNDEVYTFSLFHYAALGLSYQF